MELPRRPIRAAALGASYARRYPHRPPVPWARSNELSRVAPFAPSTLELRSTALAPDAAQVFEDGFARHPQSKPRVCRPVRNTLGPWPLPRVWLSLLSNATPPHAARTESRKPSLRAGIETRRHPRASPISGPYAKIGYGYVGFLPVPLARTRRDGTASDSSAKHGPSRAPGSERRSGPHQACGTRRTTPSWRIYLDQPRLGPAAASTTSTLCEFLVIQAQKWDAFPPPSIRFAYRNLATQKAPAPPTGDPSALSAVAVASAQTCATD